MKIALKVFQLIGSIEIQNNPQEARQQMYDLGEGYIEYLREKWFPIYFHWFDAIDWSNAPLGIGNHQTFWLEAFLTPRLVPDVTVMLKDSLLSPFTWRLWKAMWSTDPIIFHRKKKGDNEGTAKSLEEVTSQQKAVLEKWWRVLVFPEGTRIKNATDTTDMLPWKTRLYAGAYSTIEEMQKKVAIITTDSLWAFPYTFAQALSGRWLAKKKPIHFTVDVLDPTKYENIKKFNTAARELSIKRLHDYR
jgi:1-acyl-sn-glycerol-3-phosphate acyltransferase